MGGCNNRVHTHLGNGIAVPIESIDEYAAEHGVTRDEPRQRMREELGEQRIADHAQQYGISHDEARKQLEYADRKRLSARCNHPRPADSVAAAGRFDRLKKDRRRFTAWGPASATPTHQAICTPAKTAAAKAALCATLIGRNGIANSENHRTPESRISPTPNRARGRPAVMGPVVEGSESSPAVSPIESSRLDVSMASTTIAVRETMTTPRSNVVGYQVVELVC